MSKSNGGLDIKNISLFNRALLGKWLCRFFNEKHQLWHKIICSHHGSVSLWEGGMEERKNKRVNFSTWMKDILNIEGGEEGIG